MTTPTTFTVDVGSTVHLQLVLKDAAGNPGTLVAGATYTTDSPNLIYITPDSTGVSVVGLAATPAGVVAKVFAKGIGANNTLLTAESDGTITYPPGGLLQKILAWIKKLLRR